MSAKKVRKHIRRLQRERRRSERSALRDERREAKLEEKARRRQEAEQAAEEKAAAERAEDRSSEEQDVEEAAEDPVEEPAEASTPEPDADGPPEDEEPTETDEAAEDDERPRAPLIAGGVRAGAVVAAVGVLAVAGGSLALDVTGSTAQPRAVAPADVPTTVTQASLVCPPMPGRPDSVSSEGMLEYQDRDDSAEASARSIVLTAAEIDRAGVEAELGLLGQDGYETDDELIAHDADAAVEDPAETDPSEWHHAAGGLDGETDAPVLRMLAQDGASSPAGAAQYLYTADSGHVSGTAAADCRAPQRSHWFFGPEIGDGAASLLTLSNPSDRQATVEVTAYDSDGPRSGAGVRTLVVPAETVRTVNIASISGDDPVNGVEVRASQAPVAAHLQSSRASDGTGLGTEFLPSSQTETRQHVISGVPVAADSEDESAAFPTELWIRAVEAGQSTVEVQVYGEDGPAPLENASVFTVEGGEVDSVDLSGLDAGVYDLVVTTEGPSDVAVKSYGAEPEEQDRIDFGWAAGSELIRDGYGAVLPDGDDAEASLRLFAPEAGGEVVYRVFGADGETSSPQTVEVPTGGAATLSGDDLAPDDVEDPLAVVVEEPDVDVVGALMLTGEDGTFSMLPVRALDDPSGTVPVRLID
ncbi:MAG: DUF5719 family protein [Nesterenkonia sp.]|nr:DUF5719 family protein [Nesterenkonia sp.]